MKPSTPTYYVDYSVVVDRPEYRGDSYPVVPAGKVIRMRETTTSYKSAMRLRDAMLRGVDDFRSEYVRDVEVRRTSAKSERWSTVRTAIRRDPTRDLAPHLVRKPDALLHRLATGLRERKGAEFTAMSV